MAYHREQNRMPITPPDSGSGYAYSNMHYAQDYRQDGYDYPSSYAPYTSAYQQSMYQPTLPSISSYYEPVGAPILPPIRSYADEYTQYDYKKEEKATGGVSAKLDYDMDRMADFVVSTTQHIFQQNLSSPPAFRKWVHQVLSATRLPSATIMLSLHYLSDRLKVFPDTVPAGENQVYRLLSVALILGSKFLDDNTFINRSWSDVTAIKVSELNLLELKWLKLIDYSLHVDSSCVQIWVDAWNKFDNARYSDRTLAHLDTSVGRHARRYSPYPTPYSSSTMSNRTFDSRSSYTPYSAADPWAPTERSSYEDYYKRGGRYPTLSDIDDANRRAEEYARYPAYTGSQAPYSATAAPGYTPWEHYGWNNLHRSDCGCSQCSYRAWRPYGYNMGTVVG